MRELNIARLAEQCLFNTDHIESILRGLSEEQVRQVKEATDTLRQKTLDSMGVHDNNGVGSQEGKTYTTREFLTLSADELFEADKTGKYDSYMIEQARFILELKEDLQERENDFERYASELETGKISWATLMNDNKHKSDEELETMRNNNLLAQRLQEAADTLLIYTDRASRVFEDAKNVNGMVSCGIPSGDDYGDGGYMGNGK